MRLVYQDGLFMSKSIFFSFFFCFFLSSSLLATTTSEDDYLSLYKKAQGDHQKEKSSLMKLVLYYYDVNDFTKMEEFSIKMSNILLPKEVEKESGIYLSLVEKLFATRRLKGARVLSENFFGKLCHIQSKNKDVVDNKDAFFHNALIFNLLLREGERSLALMEKSSKCRLSAASHLRGKKELSRYASLVETPTAFKEIMNYLHKEKEYLPMSFKNAFVLRDMARKENNNKKVQKIVKEMERNFSRWRHHSKNLNSPFMEEADLEALAILRMEQFSLKRIEYQELVLLNAGEKGSARITDQIQQKLKMLKELTLEVQNIVDVGAINYSTEAYRLLILDYRALGKELRSLDLDNIKTLNLAQTLEFQSDDWEKKIKDIVLKEEVLFSDPTKMSKENYLLIDEVLL